MIAGPALPCPQCRRVLEPMSWHGTERGSCWNCRTDFEFIGFPQLTAPRPRPVPKAVLLAESATCYYHSTNEAEAVCEVCGRFACAVCAIDFGGRRVCPPCVATVKEKDAQQVTSRTLYDGLALGLAVLPVLMWPTTIVTSPLALGFAIHGWKKPRSLVAGSRTKLVLAALVALIQIGLWAAFLGGMWRNKR